MSFMRASIFMVSEKQYLRIRTKLTSVTQTEVFTLRS